VNPATTPRKPATGPPPVRIRNFWRDFGKPIIVGLIMAGALLLFIYRHDIIWHLTGRFHDIDLADIQATIGGE
jgi:uncharacterized RDD family membrane protein YckC